MSAVSIRRRRSEIETLDRDNPFIHPSPHAPWAVIPRPTDKTADLFEIAIVVWAVIVGLAMFALAMNS
jgi:hypothetical protein